MFVVPGGVRDTAPPEIQGFDSPEGESRPEVGTAYNIPPVLWILILLIGGYMGIRWIMED
jgi:hypothetical protein